MTSSWFVAQAVRATAIADYERAIRLIYGGGACGVLFIAIKAYEWTMKITQGYTTSNEFFMFYYMLTGVHVFHVALGCRIRCSTPTTTCTRPREALTKFLPEKYTGAIKYVEVNGRTKIAVRGQISEYIPNPTFDVVARPGALEDYFKNGNPEGKSRREIFGKPIQSIPAFREPAARVALMDEMGIAQSLMFPTLASLVEERMRDDPEMIHAVVHSLNQWLDETWSFNYQDRIFTVPVISLPIVEKAIEELEWVSNAGPRRSYPSGTGSRVPGFTVVRAAGVRPVLEARRRTGRPGHDARLGQRLLALHRRVGRRQRRETSVRDEHISDGLLVARHPRLGGSVGLPRCTVSLPGAQDRRHRERRHLAPCRCWTSWPTSTRKHLRVSPAIRSRRSNAASTSVRFGRKTLAALAELIGVERVLFGSDFPHPEGLAEPTRYIEEIKDMPLEAQKLIMGGNLARLMSA